MSETQANARSSTFTAIVLLFLTHLFWTGNIYASIIAIDHIPPILLNFMRWVVALIIVFPFAIKKTIQQWPIIRSNLLILSFFALIAVAAYNSLLSTASHTTSGINIAVISTLTPLCTFLFAWLFYKETPHIKQVIGFFLGILGVLIIIFEGSLSRLVAMQFSTGDFWMFVAVIAWAIYTVTLPKHRPDVSPIVFLFITIILGVLIAAPTVWLEYQSGARWTLQANDGWLIAYIGIFPSLLAHLFFNYGVTTIGSVKSSMFAYSLPVLTAIVGILWFNEKLGNHHIVGQILVFIGFYLAFLKNKNVETEPPLKT